MLLNAPTLSAEIPQFLDLFLLSMLFSLHLPAVVIFVAAVWLGVVREVLGDLGKEGLVPLTHLFF